VEEGYPGKLRGVGGEGFRFGKKLRSPWCDIRASNSWGEGEHSTKGVKGGSAAILLVRKEPDDSARGPMSPGQEIRKDSWEGGVTGETKEKKEGRRRKVGVKVASSREEPSCPENMHLQTKGTGWAGPGASGG